MTQTHTPVRERKWHPLRWTGGMLALVLVPKCFVCLAAYVALATGLGALGGEWCGSPPIRATWLDFITPDVWSLAGLALAMSVAVGALLVARRRRQPCQAPHAES